MRDLLLDTLKDACALAALGAFIVTIWLAAAVYIGGSL